MLVVSESYKGQHEGALLCIIVEMNTRTRKRIIFHDLERMDVEVRKEREKSSKADRQP